MSLSMNPWGSIKFTVGSASTNTAGSVSWRYRQGPDGNLIFRNNRAYKVIAIQWAKRLAMQVVEGTANSLFPKYQRLIEKKHREKVLSVQTQNWKRLINNGDAQGEPYGQIDAKAIEGNYKFTAYDRIGHKVKESLIMYYDLTEEELPTPMSTVIKIWTGVNEEKYERTQGIFDTQPTIKHTSSKCEEKLIDTRRLCHIDINPNVTISTGKNLIMTKVEGRDYSRKELVANDDLTFQISGSIDSGYMDIYPSDGVQKLIQMSQYTGVVYVNHFLFNQFNVNRVIIKDFSLTQQEYKNIQPYTMTVVAIEPDEEVQFSMDTVGVYSQPIVIDEIKGWEKFILNNKLAEISAGIVGSAASSAANAGIGAIPDLETDTI